MSSETCIADYIPRVCTYRGYTVRAILNGCYFFLELCRTCTRIGCECYRVRRQYYISLFIFVWEILYFRNEEVSYDSLLTTIVPKWN